MQQEKIFDVIIIGGSYAGLSAAMALGRSLRNVLMIDHGKPCNRQTPYSHNFLTRDGEKPAHLAAIAKEQVLKYPSVQWLNNTVSAAVPIGNDFKINTADGLVFQSKKIIIASGVKDIFPAIKGFAECWGISVIHCPYCHGYEVSHQKTGIIANGEMGFEFAKLIYNWTKDLTLFTNGPIQLDPESLLKLASKKIQVVAKEIEEIIHENGQLSHLKFKDGSIHELAAVYARGGMQQNTTLAADLQLELNEQGYIVVDPLKQTNLKGVYAAGDCTTMMRSVAEAVAAGNMAGVAVNKELIYEEF